MFKRTNIVSLENSHFVIMFFIVAFVQLSTFVAFKFDDVDLTFYRRFYYIINNDDKKTFRAKFGSL